MKKEFSMFGPGLELTFNDVENADIIVGDSKSVED